jgi:hypothetical protein
MENFIIFPQKIHHIGHKNGELMAEISEWTLLVIHGGFDFPASYGSQTKQKKKSRARRRPHRNLSEDLVAKNLCYCSKIDLAGDIDGYLAREVTGTLPGDPVAKIILLM